MTGVQTCALPICKRIKGIKTDLELIRKLNLSKPCTDEECDLLKDIAAKKYATVAGKERAFIEFDELECLMVRKGNLTEKERREIESHVLHTLNILEKIPFTEELKKFPSIAAAHHEMLDGTGYPNKLKSEQISMESRMLATADIYDALTAKDRPYKPPLPLEISLKILREEADKGRLDKDLVDLFISEKIYNLL